MPIHTTELGWALETRATGYALGVNRAGLLAHRYWGARLPYPDDYPAAPSPTGWATFNGAAQRTPEEYPAYNDLKYIDPCLKVTFADGVRDVWLRVEGADVRDGDTRLDVRLRDQHYPFRVTLHYRVHEPYDLIERWVTIANDDDTPVTLERAWSAQWHLPRDGCGADYRLSHLTGRAIAFKFALAPQCSALNRNDAAHPVEHLAIGPFDPPTAILRVTGTQCMMRYCRTTSWIWASQCHNYDIFMS